MWRLARARQTHPVCVALGAGAASARAAPRAAGALRASAPVRARCACGLCVFPQAGGLRCRFGSVADDCGGDRPLRHAHRQPSQAPRMSLCVLASNRRETVQRQSWQQTLHAPMESWPRPQLSLWDGSLTCSTRLCPGTAGDGILVGIPGSAAPARSKNTPGTSLCKLAQRRRASTHCDRKELP